MSKKRQDKEGEASHELGLFPDVNRNTTSDRFLVRPMKDKGFEYRKSIFATIFAITLAMAIIFTILYTRCSTNYIKNESECNKCHIDADCFHLSHNIKKCQCRPGFLGDGKSKCNDIEEKLVIPITEEMLLSKKRLVLRGTKDFTVCLRYKILNFIQNETLTLVESFAKNENLPIIGLYKTYKTIAVSIKDSRLEVPIGKDYINRSEHFCLVFNTTGYWKLYLNGDFYSNGATHHMRKLPESSVTVVVGERIAINKQSKMEISELLIFSKMLDSDYIKKIDRSVVKDHDVIMSWDQFHESFLDS